MGVTILHREDNALIFAFGPFGPADGLHEVVCCLRSHPEDPANIVLDALPVPMTAVKPAIASLWNLPDTNKSDRSPDPFGLDHTYPNEGRDPAFITASGLPGCDLVRLYDRTGHTYVQAENIIGIPRLFPLKTDPLPELAVACLTGDARELLTRMSDIMQTEKGLLPEECPALEEESWTTLATLLRTRHTEAFRRAYEVFKGCREESNSITLGWYANDQDMGWRRQAAGEFPLLAGFLAREPETRDAIDSAQPLLPALKTVWPNLTKGGLKRLRGIERNEVSHRPVCGLEARPLSDPDILGHVHDRHFILTGEWNIKDALRALTAVGNPSIIPGTSEDWKAFATLYAGFIRPLNITLNIDSQEIIRASKGQWQKVLDQIGTVLELNEEHSLDRHQAVVLVADMLEMCNQLGRTVLLPAMTALVHQHVPAGIAGLPQHNWPFKPDLGRMGFRMARDILMANSGRNPLLHCSQLIRRWTPRINHLNNIMARYAPPPVDRTTDDEQTAKWAAHRAVAEPLTDSFILNDVTFTPLHTAEDLAREGKEMRHCIATYKRSLLTGDSVFYHLHKDTHRATLCLKVVTNAGTSGYQFRRNGFNGVRNTRPAKILNHAVTRLINGLNGQQLATRPAFDQWRNWTRQNALQPYEDREHYVTFAEYCGYSQDNLSLNTIDVTSGLHQLTRELWEEWSMIAKCHTHPFKLIASHAENPLGQMMRKPMPQSFYDDLNTIVAEKTSDLATSGPTVRAENPDRHHQPAIN